MKNFLVLDFEKDLQNVKASATKSIIFTPLRQELHYDEVWINLSELCKTAGRYWKVAVVITTLYESLYFHNYNVYFRETKRETKYDGWKKKRQGRSRGK